MVKAGKYVDRTQILSVPPSRIALFFRPPRSGKTLELSMMEYYLDPLHADEYETLFKGLWVDREKEKIEANKGKKIYDLRGKCHVLRLTIPPPRGKNGNPFLVQLDVKINRAISNFIDARRSIKSHPLCNLSAADIINKNNSNDSISALLEAIETNDPGRSILIQVDEADRALNTVMVNAFGELEPKVYICFF